jgi:hypothetical protein
MLSDTNLFGDLDNLVINVGNEDKWLPYNNTSGTMFEVLDGRWYQKYGKFTVKDPKRNFVYQLVYILTKQKLVCINGIALNH